MTTDERRRLLTCRENPEKRLDYVVSLRGTTAAAAVRIDYVPDKLVLNTEALNAYLGALSGAIGPGLEELAAVILSDIVDKMVPRWIEVIVTARDHDQTQRILLSDRQPRWDNPQLLVRLARR